MSEEYIKEQFLERLQDLPHTLHANGGKRYKRVWSPHELKYVSFDDMSTLASFKGDNIDNIVKMEEYVGYLKAKRYGEFIRQLESMKEQIEELEGKYGKYEQLVLSVIQGLMDAMEMLKGCYDKDCHGMREENKTS